VQRTRSSPSAPHSPLTRNPLGRRPIFRRSTAPALCLVTLLVACASTQPPAIRNQINRQHFGRLNDLLRAAQASLHADPVVPEEASGALRAVTAEIDAVKPFEQTEDEKWYVGTVLIAVAMSSGEVYGAKQHWNGSDGHHLVNIRVIDCFFAAPEGCFADARPCSPVDGDTECVKEARP